MITTLDGGAYRAMLRGAAVLLRSKKEEINSLNVFPVPDGDTGTNMSLTLDGAVKTGALDGIGAFSEAAAKDMMRAARGNSGVILSLFFRGMAKAFAGHETADAQLLTEAFRSGAVAARTAVMNPVEGTILTVMRECCAGNDASPGDDIIGLLDTLYDDARETLARTPEMLPALRRAKVVDSGGCGFVYIIDGMKEALCGKSSGTLDISVEKTDSGTFSAADFSEYETEDIRFSFCTECLVSRGGKVTENDLLALRRYFAEAGDSVVMTDDEEIIKVHIHTNEPMNVIERMMALGTLQFSKIENMKLQHDRLVADGEQDERGTEKTDEEPEKKPFGVFAVANGSGLSDVFRDMGVDAVIAGGQSMNPSADDFLTAIKSVPCETAILLPNNSNIILAAVQAARIAEDVDVRVVETRTIPQGIAAMVAFNPTRTPDENVRLMEDARREVLTLSVTRAVRDADAGKLFVRKKQYIGLVEGDLRYAADTVEECLGEMAQEIADREIVTLYYGKGIKPSEAEEAAAILTRANADCEVMTVRGNQPVYSYIISAE